MHINMYIFYIFIQRIRAPHRDESILDLDRQRFPCKLLSGRRIYTYIHTEVQAFALIEMACI